jgi:HAD superfamily hydrolase (TIGR01549 family)
MSFNFNIYDSIFFDCDGVVLDSNQIKSKAFYKVALKYGEDTAQEFVKFHKENGGISRYKKIEYLHKKLSKDFSIKTYDQSVNLFGEMVQNELISSKLVPGVKKLLSTLSSPDLYIVSGGNQKEILNTFRIKEISKYFEAIGGSPATKFEIIDKFKNNKQYHNSLFIGDSRLDYEAAMHYKMDFMFIYGVSEFHNWQFFFQNKKVMIFKDFNDLTK